MESTVIVCYLQRIQSICTGSDVQLRELRTITGTTGLPRKGHSIWDLQEVKELSEPRGWRLSLQEGV